MKNILIYGGGGGLMLIAALLSAMAWTVIPAVDRVAIQSAAATYDVEIKRDDFGVPHIFGGTDADVAFGLGYAHSEDDFENIALSLVMGRGELAKYQGASGTQTDYLVHLFRNLELVEARYESDLEPATRALVEAYADGINLYALEHGEGNWRGLLPVTGKDVVAGFVFRIPFFFGVEQHLAKIFDPDGFESESDAPEGRSEVRASLLTGSSWPVGSNAFALAPGRSAEGVTRLALNSHQPYTGQVAWYEAVLQSEEGWHMAGSLFPGQPLIAHGHNENLGWAMTVNHPDLTDVYALSLNPDNENEYLFDGAWKAFDRDVAPIRVRLFGPFSWTFKRETLGTAYGPAIKLDHGAFAIAHAGMGEIRAIEQWYKKNKATSRQEWLAAMDMNAVPAFNYLYADAKGQIGYYYNARMPMRVPDYDWQGLLPGDTAQTLWQGYHGFDALPRVEDPAAGFVLNSNNSPFRATAPDEDADRADFPASFGIERRMTNRALRALQLYNDDPQISREEFYAYKFDKQVVDGSRLMNALARLKGASLEDETLRAAQQIVQEWDGGSQTVNRSAAVSILTGLRILKLEPSDLAGDIAILKGVADELLAHHGRVDVEWGEVNRIKRGDVNLPVGGGPQILRAVYGGHELDESGTLTASAGDTFIMMVAWDKEGAVRSESIHQFGSATLDETSPHYADQTRLFVEEKFKPVWFYANDLEGHVERAYRPGQGVTAGG